MSKERPFEDITPVPNIKVGYLEKKEYLKIIDEQAKQIDSFAYTIMALQSRIDILEKNQRSQGEWIITGEEQGALGIPYRIRKCNKCGWAHSLVIPNNFCPECGADMRGGDNG
jgi:rubrerythrin